VPEWQKTFSGTGNEEFSAVIETSDGGFVAAGGINAFESSTDAWVVKVDSEGSVEWEKAYGLGSQGDFASDIAATDDNGFIVTLETRQSDFPTLSLIKLSENGTIEWEKAFQHSIPPLLSTDRIGSVQQTSDGGFIVASGTAESGAGLADLILIKLESDGEIAWEKTYGGTLADFGISIQQTADGGFVVAGTTRSFPTTGSFSEGQFWVVKTDTDGNIEWEQAYGTIEVEGAKHIRQTMDGGYIVTGFSGSPVFQVIVKLDRDGAVEWQKSFGEPFKSSLRNVEPTSDGGYIVTGNTAMFGVDASDALVLKLNSEGIIENCETDLFADTALLSGESEASVDESASEVTDTSLDVEDMESNVADSDAAVQDICSTANQYSLSLFENGTDPSDGEIDQGQEVRAIATTSDNSVDTIRFLWNDPHSETIRNVTVSVEEGEDSFAPDEPFPWHLVALFFDGGTITKRLTTEIFVHPPSGDAIWDGEGDGISWSDCENWSDNQCPAEFDRVIIGSGFDVEMDVPAVLRFGSISGGPGLIIDEGASLTIRSGVTFTEDIETTLDNSGTFAVEAGVHMFLVGSLLNNAGAQIINDGSIATCASSINEGTIDNGMNGSFSVSCLTHFSNSGTINNHGELEVDLEGSMLNSGLLSNFGLFENDHDSEFTNSGTFVNSASATILNDNGASFRNEGSFDNAGTIDNDGSIFNACGSSFVNTGTVTGQPIDNEACEPSGDCTNPTIVGTEDADVIEGTDGADIIDGLGGDDTIYGLGGDDIICGGAGRDEIYGNGDNDSLFGQGGDDTIFGGHGKDIIVGGKGDDDANGGAGNDDISGNGGDDTIRGSSGDDSLSGLDGLDDNDSLDGGTGTDACDSNPDPEVNCEI
jgi:Ca2+-binding RTX toxin-like protein